MKYIYLVFIILFIVGCSTAEPIGRIGLDDGSNVLYVKSRITSPFSGETLSALDRYRYDPKTDKAELIKSDSTTSNNKLTETLKALPIPLPIPLP